METAPPPETRLSRAAPFLLILAGLAVYMNAFGVPFVFDDRSAIVDNPQIRRIWPPWRFLDAPPTTVSGRPLLSLTFAVNYAAGGLDPRGYHATNVGLHILSALLLYGVLRRTFLSADARISPAAREGSAFAAALLWLVHPLQTESVTYIVQRAEALAGFFLLSTLYLTIRAFAAPGASGRWLAAAVGACGLGMTAKEIMVAAPVLVFLYDRTFVSGSFRKAVRRRPLFYAALASTWLVLVPLVFGGHHVEVTRRIVSAGNATPWTYLLTQPEVLLHYLRLAAWPTGLCLDLGWPVAERLRDVWPQAAALAGLLAATAWGVVRRRAWGFWGAWCFLILAPTSSVVPLNDPAFEHRMYLPLVGLLAPAALTARRTLEGRSRAARAAALAAPALLLGVLAVDRNRDYRSSFSVTREAVRQRPLGARARVGMAVASFEAGDLLRAEHQARKAVARAPGLASAWNILGSARAGLGRAEEALACFQAAADLRPEDPDARANIGVALAALGRREEAKAAFRAALAREPTHANAHLNLAKLLLAEGARAAGERHLRAVLALFPDHPRARAALAALPREGPPPQSPSPAGRVE